MTDQALPTFATSSAEYDRKRQERGHAPGVAACLDAARAGYVKLGASVFCQGDHGDGPRRWRVAVLVYLPDGSPRLVTDDDNVPWPNAPHGSVQARCEACWRVLCGDCYLEGGDTEFCPHNRRGEAEIVVAKLKPLLGKQRDIALSLVV